MRRSKTLFTQHKYMKHLDPAEPRAGKVQSLANIHARALISLRAILEWKERFFGRARWGELDAGSRRLGDKIVSVEPRRERAKAAISKEMSEV